MADETSKKLNNSVKTPESPIIEIVPGENTPNAASQNVIINFNTSNFVEGIIWSEILSKPKALRRR